MSLRHLWIRTAVFFFFYGEEQIVHIFDLNMLAAAILTARTSEQYETIRAPVNQSKARSGLGDFTFLQKSHSMDPTTLTHAIRPCASSLSRPSI